MVAAQNIEYLFYAWPQHNNCAARKYKNLAAIILKFQKHKQLFLKVTQSFKAPINPDQRLAIYIFHLNWGDYLCTIGEMVGLVESTVSVSCRGVYSNYGRTLVRNCWNSFP